MNAIAADPKPGVKTNAAVTYLLAGIIAFVLLFVLMRTYKKHSDALAAAPMPTVAFEIKSMAVVEGGVHERIITKARNNPEALTMDEYKFVALGTDTKCRQMPKIPEDFKTACATASVLMMYFSTQ
jgi:hypothetical protein